MTQGQYVQTILFIPNIIFTNNKLVYDSIT